ncbi:MULTISPECIES: hypothetical protein [unclassified Polaromonas]|uniref:hypothetical protein n=1 Tax=unclassified Polaromonas TaxID=2638319 RepID=UPI001E4A7E26|nr:MULTISPECIES: hypothetical protein [unclassified Polaromonas]MDH6182699.1 hypothetical protein [Polaromonas sp. CG_23.6]
MARVTRLCGMGVRMVQKHIRALERAGIIVARLRRTGRAMRYAIAWTGCGHLPCAAPAWQIFPCAPANHAALDAIAVAPTCAGFAPPSADFDGLPPKLSTLPPAESAPITVLSLKENSKTPSAPALPAARVSVDQVNRQVMADFAAVRATKRKGPVAARVVRQ